MNTFQVNELVIIKTTDPEDAALNNKVGRISAPFGGIPCEPNALGVYLLDKNLYRGIANIPQNELFSWGDRFAFVCRVNGVTRQKDIKLLQEAYRRYLCKGDVHTLETAWLGLGTPTQYRTKNNLFKTNYGETYPEVEKMHHISIWWKLTEEGIRVMNNILQELPMPSTSEGCFELMYALNYTLNGYGDS